MVHYSPWNGRKHYGTNTTRQRQNDRGSRRAIQNSQENLRALAQRYSINQKTVAKWKKRTSVQDLPTGSVEPKSTVLSVEALFLPLATFTQLYEICSLSRQHCQHCQHNLSTLIPCRIINLSGDNEYNHHRFTMHNKTTAECKIIDKQSHKLSNPCKTTA